MRMWGEGREVVGDERGSEDFFFFFLPCLFFSLPSLILSRSLNFFAPCAPPPPLSSHFHAVSGRVRVLHLNVGH